MENNQKNQFQAPNNNEDLDYWFDLLSSSKIIGVPMEVVSSIKMHTRDEEAINFPIEEWLDEGSDIDQIKDIIKDWMKRQDGETFGSEYIINITKVRDIVQEKTDELLKVLD